MTGPHVPGGWSAAPRTPPAFDPAAPPVAPVAAPAAPKANPPAEPSTPRGFPSGEPGRRASSAHEPGATVLPEARVRRPALPGPTIRPGGAAGKRSGSARTRKARLAVKRIDPWSVFLFSLLASLFAGVALVVAVAALYSVLGSLGVVTSVNELFGEVTGEGQPLFTTKRFVGGAAVLGAVNVVLLTLLATLSALLYNLCASFTGGIEVTLGERD